MAQNCNRGIPLCVDAIYFTDSADTGDLIRQLNYKFLIHGLTSKFSINC